nr:hypothetical protein [Baekduia sp.]
MRAVPVLLDLLAVAPQHQQRVVDRQTEAEAGDDVQRVVRELSLSGCSSQPEQHDRDGARADNERQQRADRA